MAAKKTSGAGGAGRGGGSRKGALSAVAAHIHKGGLHESLGIPMDQKIPAAKLAPKPGDSPKVRRQKALARTFQKYRP
jgi:hypothetical protein